VLAFLLVTAWLYQGPSPYIYAPLLPASGPSIGPPPEYLGPPAPATTCLAGCSKKPRGAGHNLEEEVAAQSVCPPCFWSEPPALPGTKAQPARLCRSVAARMQGGVTGAEIQMAVFVNIGAGFLFSPQAGRTGKISNVWVTHFQWSTVSSSLRAGQGRAGANSGRAGAAVGA
jgi:hypothetical protein